MNCMKCGRELRIGTEQVGIDNRQLPVIHRFGYCDTCMLKTDLDIIQQPPQKKSSKHPVLDVFCVLSLVAATLMNMFGGLGPALLITLTWLIVYYIMYDRAKKNPNVDETEVKQSMYTICIFFVLQFGVVVVIY